MTSQIKSFATSRNFHFTMTVCRYISLVSVSLLATACPGSEAWYGLVEKRRRCSSGSSSSFSNIGRNCPTFGSMLQCDEGAAEKGVLPVVPPSFSGGVSSATQAKTQLQNLTLAFPHSKAPYLAVITESHSCDSDEAMMTALQQLNQAMSSNQIDLISVRIAPLLEDNDLKKIQEKRVYQMTRQLVEWSDSSETEQESCAVGRTAAQENQAAAVRIVVSSEWIDAAIEARAHGIHFKESHQHRIPTIRQWLLDSPRNGSLCPFLIGTSAHSVESARQAWLAYQPDYFFVGTCYQSLSHPEKSVSDLEGPQLPGRVRRALEQLVLHPEDDKDNVGAHRRHRLRPPPVLAIGGIDANNCQEPVQRYGADGVATIRAVLHAQDPSGIVQLMKQNMN